MRRTAAVTLVILGALTACSERRPDDTTVDDQMYDAPMRGHDGGGGGGSHSTFVNWYIINHGHQPRYSASSVARHHTPSQADMRATIAARGSYATSGGASARGGFGSSASAHSSGG